MQAIKKKMKHFSYLLFIIASLISLAPTTILAAEQSTPPVTLALQVGDNSKDATEAEGENTEEIKEGEEEESVEALEEPVVPTKIQWLILSGIALLLGLVSYFFKAHQLTTEGDLNVYPITKTFSVPLHPAIYKFMLFLTAGMALIGFAICLSIYNSVFMPDIIGVFIAGPIFAYLIHLLYLMEKGRKEES